MKTWLFIRGGIVLTVECCVDKPPDTMYDGQPATVFEVPEGANYNVGDTVDVVELKGQLVSKRDLIEMLFRLSNDLRVLQGQSARNRKQFLKFLGGLT